MYKNINVNSDTFIGDFCRLALWHVFQTYNPHIIIYVITHRLRLHSHTPIHITVPFSFF